MQLFPSYFVLPHIVQVAGKRTVLVSFWVPPEVENPEVAKRESTLDLLGASAATMLHGITGGLDAALKLKVLRVGHGASCAFH